MVKQDVYNSILRVAESFIQLNGYNAFSYRDIAAVVGVKTSSIHYHFPTKEDLGKAVVVRHKAFLEAKLHTIASNSGCSCSQKLEQFFDGIFELTYYSEQKMCVGGMLASDVLTLPKGILSKIRQFFKMIHDWLVRLIRQGVGNKEFSNLLDCDEQAGLIVSLLEGALLLSRLYQDDQRLVQVKSAIIRQLIN